jgi:hypothetical protein
MPHACFSLRMLEPPARACAVNSRRGLYSPGVYTYVAGARDRRRAARASLLPGRAAALPEPPSAATRCASPVRSPAAASRQERRLLRPAFSGGREGWCLLRAWPGGLPAEAAGGERARPRPRRQPPRLARRARLFAARLRGALTSLRQQRKTGKRDVEWRRLGARGGGVRPAAVAGHCNGAAWRAERLGTFSDPSCRSPPRRRRGGTRRRRSLPRSVNSPPLLSSAALSFSGGGAGSRPRVSAAVGAA